jgi:hypothetical protein
MRAADLTPPLQLHLPDGIIAEYIPGSEPPAYRLDPIGMAIPVDVIIPEDLAATGWYWHGSTLAWNGGDPLCPSCISTAVYPPPGWLSAGRNCFESARSAEQAHAVQRAGRTPLRSRPKKATKAKGMQQARAATAIQLATGFEGQ